jgi:hypothetical protein
MGEGKHVEAPLSAIASASRERGRSLSLGTVLDAVAVLIIVTTVVTGVLFIRRFAVNIIYYDQFTDINVIHHAHSGTLSFGLLWAQHNENRVFFPNLIVLVLAYTTHFNIVVEEYLSLVLWCSAIGLIIAAHKRRSPGMSLIYYCPVVVVVLSFTPLSAILFGYRMSWYLALLGLGAALFLLDRAQLSRLVLIGAIIAAVVGSFSALQGLFIWPAGLVLLYLRRRTKGVMALWIVCAVVTAVLYFINYSVIDAGGGTSESYVLRHPWVDLSFFFSSIGNVVSTDYAPGATAVDYPVLVLGVLIFAIAIWALVQGVRGDRSGGSPIGVALICFGLIFIASITVGRVESGLSLTGARYSIFVLMIWVGAYLSLLGSPMPRFGQTGSARATFVERSPAARSRSTGEFGVSGRPSMAFKQVVTMVALVGLIGLMCIQVISGDVETLPNVRAWHGQELTIANVMVNIDKAPDALVQSELGGYPVPFMRQMTAFARSERLSVFATSAVARYTKEGLPAGPPPVTSIAKPKDGATLSGLQWLIARATDAYGVTKVDFRLTGGMLHDALVATSTPTLFGWLGGWGTASVPNGTYKLQSVAYGAGKRSESTSITVIVANKLAH